MEEKLEINPQYFDPEEVEVFKGDHWQYDCKPFADHCNCLRCKTYSNYLRTHAPWERMYEYIKYQAIKHDLPVPTYTGMKRDDVVFDPSLGCSVDWQPADIQESMKYFFDKTHPQRFIWCLIRPLVCYDIFFAVTQGHLCADKNKRVYHLCEQSGAPVTVSNIHQLVDKRHTPCWFNENSDNLSPTFQKIAVACDELHETLVRYCKQYCTEHNYTDTSSVCFVQTLNLSNMPTFKAFQRYIQSDFEHKNYHWHFGKVAKGGNSGYHQPSPPEKTRIPSIHKIMTEYHRWLPSFKRNPNMCQPPLSFGKKSLFKDN